MAQYTLAYDYQFHVLSTELEKVDNSQTLSKFNIL